MSFSSDLLGFSNHCIQDPQMLPSRNYNGNDLISYSDINPISHTPIHNYTINPNSSKHLDEQYPPANFLYLPSPILHYGLEVLEGHDAFNFCNPQPPMKSTDDSVSYFRGEESTSIKKRNSKTAKINKVLTKTTTTGGKKSGKKDRHSKINTAQGLRDRRMRLSLKVARDFFDLQDKLGYDKGSKTVEWLLTQAEVEIKKLASGLSNMNFMSCSVNNAAKSASSATNSECEVVSQINIIEPKESSIGVKKKERLDSSSRKNAFRRGPLAKESREKARARARERTRMKLCYHHREATPCKYDQLSKLRSWSPFEASDSSSGRNNNPSMEVEEPSYHDQQENTTTPTQEDMVDNNSSVIMDQYWNITTCLSTFGYLPNTSTTTGIPQQINQSTDFQFFSKPRDSYNNHNLC